MNRPTKSDYTAPQIEVLDVVCEAGFAATNEDIGNKDDQPW